MAKAKNTKPSLSPSPFTSSAAQDAFSSVSTPKHCTRYLLLTAVVAGWYKMTGSRPVAANG
jgi:hypothetical protein